MTNTLTAFDIEKAKMDAAMACHLKIRGIFECILETSRNNYNTAAAAAHQCFIEWSNGNGTYQAFELACARRDAFMESWNAMLDHSKWCSDPITY